MLLNGLNLSMNQTQALRKIPWDLSLTAARDILSPMKSIKTDLSMAGDNQTFEASVILLEKL